jgi:hypothetical protein
MAINVIGIDEHNEILERRKRQRDEAQAKASQLESDLSALREELRESDRKLRGANTAQIGAESRLDELREELREARERIGELESDLHSYACMIVMAAKQNPRIPVPEGLLRWLDKPSTPEPSPGGKEEPKYVCSDCGANRPAGSIQCTNCDAPGSHWEPAPESTPGEGDALAEARRLYETGCFPMSQGALVSCVLDYLETMLEHRREMQRQIDALESAQSGMLSHQTAWEGKTEERLDALEETNKRLPYHWHPEGREGAPRVESQSGDPEPPRREKSSQGPKHVHCPKCGDPLGRTSDSGGWEREYCHNCGWQRQWRRDK